MRQMHPNVALETCGHTHTNTRDVSSLNTHALFYYTAKNQTSEHLWLRVDFANVAQRRANEI